MSRSNLDGVMNLGQHFRLLEDGRAVAVQDQAEAFTVVVQRCPECRSPVQNLQRYNRIWRQAHLDESTKKFVAWSIKAFVPLSQAVDREQHRLMDSAMSTAEAPRSIPGVEESVSIDLRGSFDDIFEALRDTPSLGGRYRRMNDLRRRINKYAEVVAEQEQPYGRVFSMVRNVHIQQGSTTTMEQDKTVLQTKQRILATSLRIRCDLVILADFVKGRQAHSKLFTQKGDWRSIAVRVDFSQAYEVCLGLLRDADERVLPMQQVESMVSFARLVCIERSLCSGSSEPVHLTDRVVQASDLIFEAINICHTKPGSTGGMLEEVEAVQTMLRGGTFYQAVSSDEKRDIIAAMAREVSGTGHWFRCPNGHPYVIGECGGAMQQSRCPECGETVGGAHHILAGGNARETELEEEFLRLRM
ncbi:NFX1-type zinc finger-containing protein 1 [Cyphellophora attinorum]|uniref:NFX1-type zinc finger-containing protein 1 n=1 Tax=Cyphellophora attinorum TaxID=1664694 RepID=A0A0N1NX85_9EURO|nr:NFX1-type zinc finger-containing protein 1 [Phialophora attinorum]KPI35030.1 NFX1-type zinc finger-containing protein 1 [Phialophora attinorum]